MSTQTDIVVLLKHFYQTLLFFYYDIKKNSYYQIKGFYSQLKKNESLHCEKDKMQMIIYIIYLHDTFICIFNFIFD